LFQRFTRLIRVWEVESSNPRPVKSYTACKWFATASLFTTTFTRVAVLLWRYVTEMVVSLFAANWRL